MFFLRMVGARVWQLTVGALLRFPFPSNSANCMVTHEVGHYLCSSCRWLVRASGSSQSWIGIGFPSHQILPAALETHEAGKYLCSSCRWWEQRSGSSQSWFGIGFPFNPILHPTDGGNQGLEAYSLGSAHVSLFFRLAHWWHMKLVFTYVLPADGGSSGLAAHSLGFV